MICAQRKTKWFVPIYFQPNLPQTAPRLKSLLGLHGPCCRASWWTQSGRLQPLPSKDSAWELRKSQPLPKEGGLCGVWDGWVVSEK